MAADIPFSLSGVLTYPPDDGEPAVDRKLEGSNVFKSLADFRYDLSGAGTQAVNLGTIATGVKALLVEVDADASPSAAVVNLRVNGGSDNIQIAPGGGLLYYNPKPAAGGITSASIVYTTSCTVRVRALG